MAHRDTIVIGGSAGAVAVLMRLLAALPADVYTAESPDAAQADSLAARQGPPAQPQEMN